MKKYFYRISNRIFWVYIITFFVILILMGSVILGTTRTLLMEQLGSASADVLKQIGETMNSIHISAITISNLYRNDLVILNALEQANGKALTEDMERYLQEQKQTYDITFADVGIQYEIVLLGENGLYYASQEDGSYAFEIFRKQLWYRAYYSRGSDLEFISSFKDSFGGNSEQTVFGVFRNIMDEDGKRMGTLVIKMKETIFSGKNYHVVPKSSGDYLLSYYSDIQTGWTTIEEIPCNVLFRPLYDALGILAVAVTVCMLIALSVSGYISKSISYPLLRLCETMNQVKKGNLDVISEIKGYEEIDRLKESFNDMAATVKGLLEEIRRREVHKRELEL